MTRNTFYTVMMAAMMAMVSLNSSAQPRPGRGGGPQGGPRVEMRGGHRGPHDMGPRDMGPRGPHDMGPGHRVPGPRDFRTMHGHRWDHDGWMDGWHGRVRHFDDGRWGYFREGAWYYYDRFYEPDYYFARPLRHFHSHIWKPRRSHRRTSCCY